MQTAHQSVQQKGPIVWGSVEHYSFTLLSIFKSADVAKGQGLPIFEAG